MEVEMDEPMEYVDADFDALMMKAERSLGDFRLSLERRDEDSILERWLTELCRAIRAAKLEFLKVVSSPFGHYVDFGRPFSILAQEAADAAADLPFELLKNGLKRHASEIETACQRARSTNRVKRSSVPRTAAK